MKTRLTSLLAFSALCSMAPALTAQPAEPLAMDEIETLSATVESIDHDKRLVELRTGGRTNTVQLGPEVRNLAQVKVGDQVIVHYYKGLLAEVKKKGESTTLGDTEVTTGSARTPQGSKPGAAITSRTTTTVVIEAVDRAANSVTFQGADGMTRTVEVGDPRAQKFIGTLKKGDEVEVTFNEALAVTVEPQK